MKENGRRFKTAGMMVLPLFFCACLSVQIIDNVHDPDRYFQRAHNQIERIHQVDPYRKGRAHRLFIIVHEYPEDEIIRVSVPLWLVNACVSLGLKYGESDHEFRELEERYSIDWRAIKDFGQFGPGLLVEVNDEKSKVLIWLK
ncbi:MAG: hypothetical protein WCC06_10735 [Candidatus Aminicenantales bacterium]